MRVLVTDGEERAALAIVRSLGRRGDETIVGSGSGHSLAGASRFARAELRLPDPLGPPDAYVKSLVAALRNERVDALIPVTEAALRLVLPARERLGDILLPFPDAATFAAASDKQHVLQLARELDIAVPDQMDLPDRETALKREPHVPFPLVLKPAESVVSDGISQRKLGVLHVADKNSYFSALRRLPAAAFPVLAQRRIEGAGYGVFLLRWDGRTVARFAHRRIREKPPSGGVSVYRESVAVPPEWTGHAERLLDALGWSGVAMVEFKVDAASGVPFLMEVNGRFWGSLQLAIDSGVDFPTLLLEAALGSARDVPPNPRTGVRLRWELGDLDHLLARLRTSRSAPGLTDGAPGRLRTLAAVLLPWRPGERWEVLRPSDPRPFVTEFAGWLRDVLDGSAS